MICREDKRNDIPIRKVRLIACGVFMHAIEQLKIKEKFPLLEVTYLPSNLHLVPYELKKELVRAFKSSQKENLRIACLYGDCFQDIDTLCRQSGVIKMEGDHCYEILLGRKTFREIMDENARTYFLERDLALHFEEYCAAPLELHDEEMKEAFFKDYRRLVYVRQPSDPDIMNEVNNIACFLGLSACVRDADYSSLEKKLNDLIRRAAGFGS